MTHRFLLFGRADLRSGIGDIFSARVTGHVLNDDILGRYDLDTGRVTFFE